jgi:protoheme IX farnesyltransferase
MKNNKWAYRFSLALSICTLVLIFIGGLVKSTDSGLAVPDWPLSYGRLLPPMVGGILFEHGHRMAAATVGLLTVLLAFFLTFKEDRSWVKKTAWAAVGLVILQGVLGGITVLLRLPKPISIAHACTAQTFFCLTVCLTVWTSRFWRGDTPARTERAATIPLHRLTLALVGLCFIQLILGATLRHTGRALPFHISGAVLLFIGSILITARIFRDHPTIKPLKYFSLAACIALTCQILLGVATFFILIHRFAVVPRPFSATAVITLHVALGAAALGLLVVLALVAFRTRPAHSLPLKTTFADYFTLTKPGISFMAGITALAGFVLGSHGNVDGARLFHTCVGTLLAAAGAGCLNMLIERDIDAHMKRTQSRPLPSGRLNPGEVLFLGVFCACTGVLYLNLAVNGLTAFFAALTLSVYLYVYTPLKKISSLCVTVGAVAGALPPVIGWTAATGQVGIEAVVLFGILFFWQYPHFLSLAWLYKDDYALGGLHMLPHFGANTPTGWHVVLHSVALLAVSVMPTFLGLTGIPYVLTAFAMGGAMVWLAAGFLKDPTRSTARRVFFFSLLYVPVLVALMLVNGIAAAALR